MPSGSELKIGECHGIAYGFQHLLFKYEVRKFSRFVRFTFGVINMYHIPTGMCLLHDIMRILSELVFMYITNVGINRLLHDI